MATTTISKKEIQEYKVEIIKEEGLDERLNHISKEIKTSSVPVTKEPFITPSIKAQLSKNRDKALENFFLHKGSINLY